MKVLHVLRSVSPRLGGTTTALQSIVTALAAHGVENHVLATNYGELSADDGYEMALSATEDMKSYIFPMLGSLGFSLSTQLWTWLGQNVQNYDLLHIHGVFTFPPLSACFHAQRMNVPYILRPAGTLDPWSLRQKAFKKRLFYKVFLDSCLRRAASVHVTSEAEREALELLGLSENVKIVPHGVEHSQRHKGRVRGTCDSLRLLFLGRLHPKKNLPLVLRAVARLRESGPRIQLEIVGDGEPQHMREIRRLVEELGIAGVVTFRGFLHGDEKADAFHRADVFVLTSHQENFGMAVVEAMAAGLPVVISDGVALATEVEAANAGRIVSPLNVEALVNALREMADPNCREALGQNARQLAEQSYSLEAMGRNLVAYYEQVSTQR